jgi:hypothetical protein
MLRGVSTIEGKKFESLSQGQTMSLILDDDGDERNLNRSSIQVTLEVTCLTSYTTGTGLEYRPDNCIFNGISQNMSRHLLLHHTFKLIVHYNVHISFGDKLTPTNNTYYLSVVRTNNFIERTSVAYTSEDGHFHVFIFQYECWLGVCKFRGVQWQFSYSFM